MQLLYVLHPVFTALLLAGPAQCARKPSNSVLLSNVKTLTLHKESKTSHRRVSAIPQLKCVGGNAKGVYEIDVMRCKNAGSDYDDDDIQWTCTANLPEEFRLGSTDVICEGYDSPQDPYVLKGSCGVEYRLMLTNKGEERYGTGGFFAVSRQSLDWQKITVWTVFLAIAGWIVYSAWIAYQGGPRARRPPRNRGFWGGGWGGGPGGGGGNDPYDPPPPYPGKPRTRGAGSGQEDWRPGFWTGALSGAAAGYLAGNRGSRQQQEIPRGAGGWFGGGNGNYGNTWGAGTSTRPTTRSSSGSSPRHESTGFGSTRRR